MNNSKLNEAFISKARAKHGDKYDYSRVEYVKSKSKVTIHCFEHGDFFQSPNEHLSGQGCKRCGIASRLTKQKSNYIEFVTNAAKKHEGKYA